MMGPLANKQMVCIAYSFRATFAFDYASHLFCSFLPNASFTSVKCMPKHKVTAWYHLPRKVIFLFFNSFLCILKALLPCKKVIFLVMDSSHRVVKELLI